jgi:transaldolase
LKCRIKEDYAVTWGAGVDADAIRAHVLWDIGAAETTLVESLRSKPATTAAELLERATDSGARDLFPTLSKPDWKTIADDGKIPRHETWAARIASGELAIDTLLNYAALQSFTADQRDMDERIRKYL